MIDPTIQRRIDDKIIEVLLKLQSAYNTVFDIPEVKYRQMGMVSGKAYYSEWKIELNPDYLRNGHLDDMIDRTLPHEIAHLVSYKVFGPVIGRGHGRGWKSVMYQLGLPPTRCHMYSMEGVKSKSRSNIPSKCPVCGEIVMLTEYRVNQIKTGIKILHRTPTCKSNLTLVLV